MRFVSAEKALYRGVISQLYQADLLQDIEIHGRQADGIGYDENMNKITPFSYLIVGESSITSSYSSQSHTEEIAITFHLYHRSNNFACEDETRDLMERLDYVIQAAPVLDHYHINKIRRDNKQVIPDIDLETLHGILRIRYEVKHKLK